MRCFEKKRMICTTAVCAFFFCVSNVFVGLRSCGYKRGRETERTNHRTDRPLSNDERFSFFADEVGLDRWGYFLLRLTRDVLVLPPPSMVTCPLFDFLWVCLFDMLVLIDDDLVFLVKDPRSVHRTIAPLRPNQNM